MCCKDFVFPWNKEHARATPSYYEIRNAAGQAEGKCLRCGYVKSAAICVACGNSSPNGKMLHGAFKCDAAKCNK
jgi:hypothetical protein